MKIMEFLSLRGDDKGFYGTILFSELHFYGIFINWDLSNSFTFRYFLNNLIEARKGLFK